MPGVQYPGEQNLSKEYRGDEGKWLRTVGVKVGRTAPTYWASLGLGRLGGQALAFVLQFALVLRLGLGLLTQIFSSSQHPLGQSMSLPSTSQDPTANSPSTKTSLQPSQKQENPIPKWLPLSLVRFHSPISTSPSKQARQSHEKGVVYPTK